MDKYKNKFHKMNFKTDVKEDIKNYEKLKTGINEIPDGINATNELAAEYGEIDEKEK